MRNEINVNQKTKKFVELWEMYRNCPVQFDYLFLAGIDKVIIDMINSKRRSNTEKYWDFVEKSLTFMTTKYILNYVSIIPFMVKLITGDPSLLYKNYPVLVLQRFIEDAPGAVRPFTYPLSQHYAKKSPIEGEFLYPDAQDALFTFIQHK